MKYYDFSCAIRDAPIAASRIFFLDIVYKLDLLALTLAVWKYSKNSDQFWLVYRHPIPNTKWNIINVLTRILHRKLQHRLVTFTDSEKVRSTFQGLPFSPIVLPIPHTRHVFPKASAATPEKIICWWPGYPRAEKGWESIQKLVCVESPHAKFFVLVAAKAAKLTSKDTQIKVELIDDELSDDEFTQKLAECHIVLLPYDPHQYYARTSGIFVEAVVAHKIPLVKKNSWLASELERFDLHELIIDWDRPDFFSYILNIVNDQKIKTKLASMQKSYAKFHGMDVFKEKISAALNVD